MSGRAAGRCLELAPSAVVDRRGKTRRLGTVAIIRAAITQTTWTGDKESMLDKHEQFARDAKAEDAQVICFQELFYGPYFGITEDKKYYSFAEAADGPIVQRFAALAKELSMVM